MIGAKKMWERKEIKEIGKKHFKKNYWPCVIVCFLLAFLGCEYSGSATLIHGYNSEATIPENVITKAERLTNMTIFDANDNIITVAIEVSTSTISYTFKLIGSIKDFILSNYTASLILALVFIIEFIYVFMICNPLIVGSRKFFIENNQNKKVKMGILLDPFKNKGYLNIVKTMLLQTIYLFLWLFTIIGFIIKIYEYRMIPFILAENPNLKTKEIFKKSKQMMKNNKWEMFKFDASYIGWYILNILTLGLTGIFYSNPYKAAGTAQIYLKLKGNI